VGVPDFWLCLRCLQLQETEARRDALQSALEAAQADLRQLAAALQQASQVGTASLAACQWGGTIWGLTPCHHDSQPVMVLPPAGGGTGGCVCVCFLGVTAVMSWDPAPLQRRLLVETSVTSTQEEGMAPGTPLAVAGCVSMPLFDR
jgi:hypothetical protein